MEIRVYPRLPCAEKINTSVYCRAKCFDLLSIGGWAVACIHIQHSVLYKLTCSVQLTLFFRNSTNLSTTPGVFITSSIGGLGSESNRAKKCKYLCLVYGALLTVIRSQLDYTIPLESSFLNLCVVLSWSSGSSEKSISTMSLVMTPSCNNKYTSTLRTWSIQPWIHYSQPTKYTQ